MLRRNPGRDSRIEYLPHFRFWILESENITDIGGLYKVFKLIFAFQSETAKEKFENTDILSCFGDYELILTMILYSQKWEGPYFCDIFPF